MDRVTKTREQFVDRWKKHLAGMALFGVASETNDGALAMAGKILEIPGEVEQLLALMYDFVTQSPDPSGAVMKQAGATTAATDPNRFQPKQTEAMNAPAKLPTRPIT
jgi:hypothetical protein